MVRMAVKAAFMAVVVLVFKSWRLITDTRWLSHKMCPPGSFIICESTFYGTAGFCCPPERHQLLGMFPPSTTCSKTGNISSVKTCLPRGHILWESLQVKVTSRNVERADCIVYRIVKPLLYEA